MPFSVMFNEEAGYIHAVYEGKLDLPGIKDLLGTVGLAVKEHDCYLVPAIRADFDRLESQFLARSEGVRQGSLAEKKDFMDHCFPEAMRATETWIALLRSQTDLAFEDPKSKLIFET